MAVRIVVGMSGGVDSSVAAALLVEQGHDVVGVTLRVWPWHEAEEATRKFGSCCSPETVADARAVARRLGIPYYLLNTEREFARAVIEPFARAYVQARTPVPCVACNRDVKFGSLLQRARAWDAAAVATGHYARITRDRESGRFLLWRGRDARKDQSDFLWPLTQAQLAAARFPVGDLTKEAVREKARAVGLETADKPESQEICFIPDDDYRGFLRRRVPEAFAPGPIVDGQGTVLGQHGGLASYTVGQRRGLGLVSRRPLYVTALDPDRNALVVGEAAAAEMDTLVAEQANFISVAALTGPLEVTAKIRHSHAPAPAVIEPLGEPSADPAEQLAQEIPGQGPTAPPRVRVRFAQAQWAPAPGQSVVFYQGDLVVGGGVIARPQEA
jgi:tRNA-specific 2-thiouridylase